MDFIHFFVYHAIYFKHLLIFKSLADIEHNLFFLSNENGVTKYHGKLAISSTKFISKIFIMHMGIAKILTYTLYIKMKYISQGK